MKDYVVIFDLDGTLLDTNTLIFESFKHTFKTYKPDYVLSQEELLSFLGPSLWDSFGRYFPSELVDECVDCYREHNHPHHKDFVKIYPYVKETLLKLKEEGYPLAILTTKHEEAASIGIDLFELRQYFDYILCGDHVSVQKPDPEGIYKVLKHFNCNKGVMVGDSTSDILAGKNACIDTIAVDWSPKGVEAIQAVHPDLLISDMREVINYVKERSS